VADWQQGATTGVYDAGTSKADVTKSPTPRFDLLRFEDYLYVGVQYSRGCPFTCEFCDIIELYGRVPRMKTNEQMLGELESLYRMGYRGHVDFVDDNLIGNKKALKKFLPDLQRWLADHGHPFEFSTEASLNLADDAELLQMLQACGFFGIFVGIESPDAATLVHAQKRQNTRRVIADSIRTIYRAGMFVSAGFILGFDSESGSVAEGMIDCIEDTAIPGCMIGLLYALPNTQLTRRLATEGRLAPDSARLTSDDEVDQCTSGLNFDTRRPRREILSDYKKVLDRVYEPAAYFARVRRVGRQLDSSKRTIALSTRQILSDLKRGLRLMGRMGVREPLIRREYWKTLIDCIVHNPRSVKYVVSMMALYLHFGPFARVLSEQLAAKIARAADGMDLAVDPLPAAAYTAGSANPVPC